MKNAFVAFLAVAALAPVANAGTITLSPGMSYKVHSQLTVACGANGGGAATVEYTCDCYNNTLNHPVAPKTIHVKVSDISELQEKGRKVCNDAWFSVDMGNWTSIDNCRPFGF